MKNFYLAPAACAVLAALAAASSAAAQGAPLDQRCAATTPTTTGGYSAALVQQDACQKSVDLFNYLAPQLGALVAGGSAELGRGGTLGGLGRFGLALRANVIGGGRIPDLSQASLSVTGAARTNFAVKPQTLALPTADLGVGLFAGVPVGLTRIGGLDLLLSGGYVPSFSSGTVRVDRTGPTLQLGYGARVGLLERSRFVPGVGLTYLRRELPATSILATTSDGGTIGVYAARVRTNSWRLSADQHVSILGVTAGVGQDRYDSQAAIAGSVAVANIPGYAGQTVSFNETLAQRLTRTNVYAGASVRAGGLAQLVAEVGRASGGGSVPTYNGFSGRAPTDAYTYVSLGLRVGR